MWFGYRFVIRKSKSNFNKILENKSKCFIGVRQRMKKIE